jgi:hypothetical protein
MDSKIIDVSKTRFVSEVIRVRKVNKEDHSKKDSELKKYGKSTQ